MSYMWSLGIGNFINLGSESLAVLDIVLLFPLWTHQVTLKAAEAMIVEFSDLVEPQPILSTAPALSPGLQRHLVQSHDPSPSQSACW